MLVPAPVLMFSTSFFVKTLYARWLARWYYTLQRTCAEVMLSIALLDRRLRFESAILIVKENYGIRTDHSVIELYARQADVSTDVSLLGSCQADVYASSFTIRIDFEAATAGQVARSKALLRHTCVCNV